MMQEMVLMVDHLEAVDTSPTAQSSGDSILQIRLKALLAGSAFPECYLGNTLLFDNELFTGQSVLIALSGYDDFSSSTASKYGGMNKTEPITLTQLNNNVVNSPLQVGELYSFHFRYMLAHES